MRDKLKPPTDYAGIDPIRYYLYDIALSMRELVATKEQHEVPFCLAPANMCTCGACKPQTPKCAGCFGGRCDECPTDEAGYAVKVQEAKYPAGYLASKYFCSNPDHDEGGGSWNED